MAEEGSFHEFEHTADIGVEVRAQTLAGLFSTAGRALFSLMIDSSLVEGHSQRKVEMEAGDLVELMHEWLQRLLVLFMVDGFVAGRIDVRVSEPGTLGANLEGEAFDPVRHRFKSEIKGVTFHELEVRREGDGWLARIIFDV